MKFSGLQLLARPLLPGGSERERRGARHPAPHSPRAVVRVRLVVLHAQIVLLGGGGPLFRGPGIRPGQHVLGHVEGWTQRGARQAGAGPRPPRKLGAAAPDPGSPPPRPPQGRPRPRHRRHPAQQAPSPQRRPARCCGPVRAPRGTTPRVALRSHRAPRTAAPAAAIFTFSAVRRAHAQRRLTVAERGQTRPAKPAQRSPGSSRGRAWAVSGWQEGEKTKLLLVCSFKLCCCCFSPSAD